MFFIFSFFHLFFLFVSFFSRPSRRQTQKKIVEQFLSILGLGGQGVKRTQGGIAGIGLGESMIQLPRMGWRLLACQNGASPDWIVDVVVMDAALLRWNVYATNSPRRCKSLRQIYMCQVTWE